MADQTTKEFWKMIIWISVLWNIFISRASNIAFLLDIAKMLDLDFGFIQQNISINKASFQY